MILFYNTRTSHVNHDSTSSILAAYERTTKAAIYTVLEVGNSQHPSVELADSINSRGLQIRHFKNDSCQVINFFNCNNHRAINFFNRELVVPLMHILFITFFSLFVFHLQTDITRGPIAVVCQSTPSTDDWLQWLISADHWTYWQLKMTESFEFWLIIRSSNVEKCSIAEYLCSLLAPLVCVIFSCVKICNGINYFNHE